MSRGKGTIIKTPIQENYGLGRVMGRGGFATVKLGKRKSDSEAFAVKVISKSALTQHDSENLASEVSVMSNVSHPNIVEMVEVYEDSANMYVVMELMREGELFDRIVKYEHYSEAEAKQAFMDILMGLQYLHSRNIIHRDLKPENLLYKSDTLDAPLKLADFGFATVLKPNELLHMTCGSPNYVAPEVINTSSKGYDTKADIWSIGVILFVLLCGYPPFYAEDINELFQTIIQGQFQFDDDDWAEVSASAKKLISSMLQTDPTLRPSVDDILKHEWLTSGLGNGDPYPALSKQKDNLKKYNSRRKFRGAVEAVRLAARLSHNGSVSVAKSASQGEGTEAGNGNVTA